MTRPQIIRADTIDLQDHHSPSAQDHSRHHADTGLGAGRTAPHHDLSMRNAEQAARHELGQSPRASGQRANTGGIRSDTVYTDEDETAGAVNGSHNDGMLERNGVSPAEGEDQVDGEVDDTLDDDMMDKISSSPSIDDEDIDFEFVYALHTFVATVEGQANATKGDTMVLLDDSNSYWWLVRVVKDGSIGYLPAEHIETPTERLARLNKHRNIDLSATMLGDNPEKSKNPLKKAMRRRNAKTVTFAAPTYYEPSIIDYSTEEEEDDDGFFEDEDETGQSDIQDTQPTEDTEDENQSEDIVVEPLRLKPHPDKDAPTPNEEDDSDRRASPEKPRISDESHDKQGDHVLGRSRNGTVRNTDSFFKDDTVETKKISLTPNLLRDDTSSAASDPKEMKNRGSFETLDKVLNSGEKAKDDKKRKDKKPGMLSGLFKRKDKKSKVLDDDVDEQDKVSEDSFRSTTPPKVSVEPLAQEARSSKPQASPQRQPSKLQKPPPADASPIKSDNSPVTGTLSVYDTDSNSPSPSKEKFGSSVSKVATDIQPDRPKPLQIRPPENTGGGLLVREQARSNSETSSPMKTTFLNSSTLSIDTLQKPSENSSQPGSVGDREANKQSIRHVVSQSPAGRLSESPVNIPSVESEKSGNLPALTIDTRSGEEKSVSRMSSQSSSPELVEVNEIKGGNATPTSTATSSANTPTWSDASLRSYLEDESDIRDLLIIVHDKSNIPPAGPDHPITGSLFKDESRELNEMSNRLDEMLNSWLARKTESVLVK